MHASLDDPVLSDLAADLFGGSGPALQISPASDHIIGSDHESAVISQSTTKKRKRAEMTAGGTDENGEEMKCGEEMKDGGD